MVSGFGGRKLLRAAQARAALPVTEGPRAQNCLQEKLLPSGASGTRPFYGTAIHAAIRLAGDRPARALARGARRYRELLFAPEDSAASAPGGETRRVPSQQDSRPVAPCRRQLLRPAWWATAGRRRRALAESKRHGEVRCLHLSGNPARAGAGTCIPSSHRCNPCMRPCGSRLTLTSLTAPVRGGLPRYEIAPIVQPDRTAPPTRETQVRVLLGAPRQEKSRCATWKASSGPTKGGLI